MSALAASILLIYLYRYLTSESGKYVTISGRGFKPALIDLKLSRYPLMGVIGLLSFVLIVLPVMVLFYTSMLPYVMVPTAKAFSQMNWKNWTEVLRDPISLLALRNSITLGVVGATLGVIVITSYSIHYTKLYDRPPIGRTAIPEAIVKAVFAARPEFEDARNDAVSPPVGGAGDGVSLVALFDTLHLYGKRLVITSYSIHYTKLYDLSPSNRSRACESFPDRFEEWPPQWFWTNWLREFSSESAQSANPVQTTCFFGVNWA